MSQPTTTRVYRGIEYSYRVSGSGGDSYDIWIRFPEQIFTASATKKNLDDVDTACRQAIDQHYEGTGP